MPKQKRFDRRLEDIGNILALEHVNLRVPDQSLATLFYVSVLGLTRDPYVDFGAFNVWINAGSQQFHLPTGEAQTLRGEIGLVVPDLDALTTRLDRTAGRFRDTHFSYERQRNAVLITCPWGNKIRCRPATPEMALGIPYIQLKVEKHKLAAIAKFYQQIFRAPVKQKPNQLDVTVGVGQTLQFKATKHVAPYDGHHIAIYTPDFSGPYDLIRAAGCVMEESNQHQYRFKTIYDPDSGTPLFDLEHEVRSLHHPMFNRFLTNRNSSQSFAHYTKGRDAFYPEVNSGTKK